MSPLPKITCATAAFLCSLNLLQAGDATWNQSATGSYDWNAALNWNPNTTFPNASGDIANLNNDVAGVQTIRLRQDITVGTLNLGDASGTSAFSITNLSPETFSLTFQSSSGPASLNNSGGANSIGGTTAGAEVNVTLASHLNVTTSTNLRLSGLVTNGGNTITIANPTGTVSIYGTNTAASSGGITGAGGLTKYGSGTLSFASGSGGGSTSGSDNTFIGPTNITGGVVSLISDKSRLSSSSSFAFTDAQLNLGTLPSSPNKLGSGTISFTNSGMSFGHHNSSGTRTESLGPVTIAGGQTSFNGTNSVPTLGTARFSVGGLTRTPGGTLLLSGFSWGGTGATYNLIGTLPSNQNGLVPWILVNPSRSSGGFGFNSGTNGMDEYAAYTSGPITNSPASNFRTIGSGATENLAADSTINSLSIETEAGAYTLADGAGTSLTVGASGGQGAILSRGNLTTPATATSAAINVSNLNFTGEGIVYTEGAAHTLTISSAISGTSGLTKGLAGSLVITSANPGLTGDIRVNAGSFVLAATGSFANVSNIRIEKGATYDVSAVAGYTVGLSQALIGKGTVEGDVAIAGDLVTGGTGTVGTLAFDGDLSLTLDSTATFDFKLPSFTAETFDLVTEATTGRTISFGGTLALSFDPSQIYLVGSTVQIFDFSTYAGSFDTITFNGLGTNQVAQFDSLTGFVTIAAIPEPSTTSILVVGLALLLTLPRYTRMQRSLV